MKKHQSAFTLIEIMMVILFLSILGVYTWTYLNSTMKVQKTIEAKTTIQQIGLSIMGKLQDDISQVFFAESYQKLTYFNGETNSLSFTALSHDAANPDDRECEEAEITYSLEADSENPNTQMLLRKEVPFLDSEQEKNDGYLPVVVAHNVASLEFSYSDDGTKYDTEWNIANSDHLNKLPKLVKIILTVKDKDEREEYFESIIDLPMTDDLNVRAAAAPAKTSPSKTPTPNSKGPTSATPTP